MACLALVLDHARDLAGERRRVEAEDLDRLAGPRLLDLLAAVVEEAADAAVGVCRRRSRRRRGACRAGRASSPPCRGRRRGATRRSGRTPPPSGWRAGRARRRPRAAPSRAGRRDSVFCFADTSENCVVPPHSSGCSPSVASSLLTRSVFASGRSILLIATTIGTSAARACEIDSFVCGMTPSSAATTRTARSVTLAPRARMAVNASWPGGVEERDLPAVVVDLVGADVLRDPAGFRGGDRRLADRVQERRLAVVDVAHDRDDRRPGGERLLGVVEDLRSLVLLAQVLDRHLALELRGDQLDLVVGQRLRRRSHLAEAHEDLDDLLHRDAERLREVADGDARLDEGGPGRRRGRLVALRLARDAVARPARVGTRAAGTGVDHDAALAAPGTVAAGANRSVRTFSHCSKCKGLSGPDRRGRWFGACGRRRVVPPPARSS